MSWEISWEISCSNTLNAFLTLFLWRQCRHWSQSAFLTRGMFCQRCICLDFPWPSRFRRPLLCLHPGPLHHIQVYKSVYNIPVQQTNQPTRHSLLSPTLSFTLIPGWNICARSPFFPIYLGLQMQDFKPLPDGRPWAPRCHWKQLADTP